MIAPHTPLPLDEDGEPEEGRRVTCRLCGRPLTGREARLWGLGDGCRAKLAERSAPRPARGDVDQDALPGLTDWGTPVGREPSVALGPRDGADHS
ncbi:DUF6011 domain-containing protein [Streptantibioticus ferralitis]|uniref:DUF6011 domain-containing protein n=1 Tax=Streptantibioticus ferralitis TaxID=236510 RepID=UPI0027E3276F|nr:DUF6011 domain-containing protein [Streptantibioticus ferralitis]